MAKKVKNTINVQKKVVTVKEDEIPTYLYTNEKAVIDFSSKISFYCCEEGDFNNYLKNEIDFIQNFRLLQKLLNEIKSRPLNELNQAHGYRHCHIASSQPLAQNIIKKLCSQISDNPETCKEYYSQNFEDEEIHQIGIQDGIRVYGIKHSNIFSVTFIDWFHTFDYDEAYNQRNLKHYKFEPMKTELESS